MAASQEAVNAHHFLKILRADNIGKVCDKLCLLAAQRCREYGQEMFEVECIMSDYNGIILGKANVKK